MSIENPIHDETKLHRSSWGMSRRAADARFSGQLSVAQNCGTIPANAKKRPLGLMGVRSE